MVSKYYRYFLHFLVGLVNIWLIYLNQLTGVIFSIGFLIYEIVEHWSIKDKAHIDIYGWLYGCAIGSVVFKLLDGGKIWPF